MEKEIETAANDCCGSLADKESVELSYKWSLAVCKLWHCATQTETKTRVSLAVW